MSTPDGSQDDRVCLVFLDKAEVHHASLFEVVLMHDWTVSTTRALAVCQLCGQRLGVTRLLVTLVSEEKAVKKQQREEQTR